FALLKRRERCPRYPAVRSRVVRRFFAAWTPRLTLAIYLTPSYFKPSMRLAVIDTVLLPVASLLKRRVTREDLCSRRWRFPARSCITLPVPVRRNVFLAPLWVFIFGTSYLLVGT